MPGRRSSRASPRSPASSQPRESAMSHVRSFQLDELDLLEAPSAAFGGQPMQIPLDAIDEDPHQPRTEFDDSTLAELAASIAERGVLQPVSVRPNPDSAGRWILNFGARRLRACRLASLERISAFVDSTVDDYAQVVENG